MTSSQRLPVCVGLQIAWVPQSPPRSLEFWFWTEIAKFAGNVLIEPTRMWNLEVGASSETTRTVSLASKTSDSLELGGVLRFE